MKPVETKRDDGVELETQVILRMPEEPARALREAVREGANSLKDRLSVKLENDVRYGEVRFDHWLLHAKVVDLPTVIESLKTIDNKSFYKTADICQIIICKDEPDAPTIEEELPNKNKKKDPNKVDKKFLWPHGVTPPCKNIRKRRFRKTLKKKCIEAPEIEKEVKRLLRADNEAVNCKWDIINEEDEKDKGLLLQSDMGGMQNEASTSSPPPASMGTSGGVGGSGGDNQLQQEKSKKSKNIKDKGSNANEHRGASSSSATGGLSQMPRDIDIFGEDVSSDDDDDDHRHHNINVELDETSRLSADDDSRLSDFSVGGGNTTAATDKIVTEFNKTMFNESSGREFYGSNRLDTDDNDFNEPQLSQSAINIRISELRRQLNDLRNQRIHKEQEISSIENQALRQRLQDSLDTILGQILDHEMEMQHYQSMLV